MELVKSAVKKMLASFGFCISRVQKPCNAEYFYLTKFLNYYLERHGTFFLLQIGANDGITFDPIRQFITENTGKVEGILVEPMKDAYTKLTMNYKDFPGILTENLAIHNEKKQMILHKVNPEKLDQLAKWSGGMASFNPNHHILSGIPKEFIIQETVQCLSLKELLRKHNVEHLDLLQIDTEGYDAEIIKGIDFNSVKPSIIRFEHGHMDGIMDAAKIQEIFSLLNSNGYQIIIESYDATAYLPFKLI